MIHKLIEYALVISLAFNLIALGANIEDGGFSKKSIFRLIWCIFIFVLFLACTRNNKGGNN